MRGKSAGKNSMDPDTGPGFSTNITGSANPPLLSRVTKINKPNDWN